MNKQFLLACLAGVVVLLVFGYAIFHTTSQPQTQTDTATANQPAAAPDAKLKIQDEKVGTGAAVKSGDTVVINCTISPTKFLWQ